MDVRESEQALRKLRTVDTQRLPLVPADDNNAVVPRQSRTREVSSRYKSPSPATSSSGRRSSSPNLTRTTPTVSQLVPKRAQTAERKRPSTPLSPRSPSTPVHDSYVNIPVSSKKIAGSRLLESLWPSTMRSLSVSFQSDTISIPVSKKVEKPVASISSERTLRPSSNVAPKKVETPTVPRKATPERKRSPLKGKNTTDHTENSKPIGSFPTRLIDQHRWPSRIRGKESSNKLNRSLDFGDRNTKILNTPSPGIGLSSMRRLSIGEIRKSVYKSTNDAVSIASPYETFGLGLGSVDDNLLKLSRPQSSLLVKQSNRTLGNPTVRSQSLPSPGSRPPSPGKSSIISSSRGISPSPSRPFTPCRGASPSRTSSTAMVSQSNGANSVLTFIADVRKGKKGVNYIEDAHQLRLLYNRYLQCRFANARAEAVLRVQEAAVERTLHNVWYTISCLWDSVTMKRISVLQLKLALKLNAILNEQMPYLDDWSLLEINHIDALSRAIDDLEASTLHLPVTGGAKANIESLKTAICSAVEITQVMGSSVYSLLSKFDRMNNLASELAVIASKEKAFLEACEALLASRAAMQVKECSLRTHLMQLKRALGMGV